MVWRAGKGLGLNCLALPLGGGGWSKQLDGGTRAECVSHLPYSWQARGACLNHNISACSVTGKPCEVVIYWRDQVFDVTHWIRVMWSFIKWKPELVLVSHTPCEKWYQSADLFKPCQAISRYGGLHRTNWNFAPKQLPHLLLATFWPEPEHGDASWQHKLLRKADEMGFYHK